MQPAAGYSGPRTRWTWPGSNRSAMGSVSRRKRSVCESRVNTLPLNWRLGHALDRPVRRDRPGQGGVLSLLVLELGAANYLELRFGRIRDTDSLPETVTLEVVFCLLVLAATGVFTSTVQPDMEMDAE